MTWLDDVTRGSASRRRPFIPDCENGALPCVTLKDIRSRTSQTLTAWSYHHPPASCLGGRIIRNFHAHARSDFFPLAVWTAPIWAVSTTPPWLTAKQDALRMAGETNARARGTSCRG